MGTENNITSPALSRKRGQTLMVVITAGSKFSISQQEHQVHITLPNSSAPQRDSGGTIQEKLALDHSKDSQFFEKLMM